MKECNWLQRWWHGQRRRLTFASSTRSGPEWRCQCGIRYRSSVEYRRGLMLLLSTDISREKPVEVDIKPRRDLP